MNASTLGRTVLKAHRGALALLIASAVGAIAALLSSLATGHGIMNMLTGIMAVALIALCLERLLLQPGRASRMVWTAGAILLAAAAFHKFTAPAAPQSDGVSVRAIDVLELIALQVAFIAVLAILFVLRAARLNHGRDQSKLGDLARFLFVYAGYFDRLRYPDFKRRMHLPFARQLIFVVHFLRWLPDLSPHVRRLTGRSTLRQAIDIVTLHFRHDLDAQAYYMFELYRPERSATAAGYLTRFETKNGLFYRLNRLFQRRRPDGRSWLGDKIRFAELCAELGIRCVPVLARIEAGEVRWMEGVDRRLPQDFFVKRRIGKGALGAGLYRHLPDGRHRTPSGMELPTETLLADLAERSSQMKRPRGAGEGALLPAQERAANKGALLIQPRLRNHPEIADLAEESLMVMRVITCLDQDQGVIAAYAMLRILGVLEPRWQTKVEFAAPVDLASGRLGVMTGDKGEMATRCFEQHPILPGVAVAGRVIPHFKAMLAEAMAAHHAYGDRFLVGWDIAITPDGPLIVEGNAHPDLEFPQRVHARPISESPMGPSLYRHLMRLERSEPLFALTRRF